MDKYEKMNPWDRQNENSFSFWFPAVEHCGIRTPKSLIFPVPEEIRECFFMERYTDWDAIDQWVKTTVNPELMRSNMGGRVFLKNGVFSNKFHAEDSCLPNPGSLTDAVCRINYEALCAIDFGNDGTDELVVREWIPFNISQTPCIYHGLPFRPEFRVFYDFDIHEVIFSVNYWDAEYCAPHLYEMTDKIIFAAMADSINQTFLTKKAEVERMVAKAMASINSLSGPWSIDLLWDGNEFWLIDMAVAETSAYWELRPGNEEKAAAEKAKSMTRMVKRAEQQMIPTVSKIPTGYFLAAAMDNIPMVAGVSNDPKALYALMKKKVTEFGTKEAHCFDNSAWGTDADGHTLNLNIVPYYGSNSL